MSQWQWLRSFVRQAKLFAAEQKRHATGRNVFADSACSMLKPLERMLQFAMPDGSSADDQCAVGNGVGNALVFRSVGQHVCRADCGARFAKRHLVGIHHPQAEKAEVAHGARSRAYVERIPRLD